MFLASCCQGSAQTVPSHWAEADTGDRVILHCQDVLPAKQSWEASCSKAVLTSPLNLQADSAAYQAEKQLKEFGDKVPAEVKSQVEAKITSVREAISKDDTELMKSEMEGLQQEMMKVGQAVYSQAGQQEGGDAGAAGPGGAPGADKKDGGDNVVDAEFTDTDK